MNKFVYLIQSTESELYKIGVSSNPKRRIKTFQTACPYELKIVETFESKYPYKVETFLHNNFKYMKRDENEDTLGGEWFNLTKEQVENFIHQCKQVENNITLLKENKNHFI